MRRRGMKKAENDPKVLYTPPMPHTVSVEIKPRDHGIHLSNIDQRRLGAVSIRKTVLPGMVIPMLKIRRPNGRLIFNMEIAIRR